ncbi:hypothetical protein BT93_F1136 [Corymbia citriodora subsp. variegata]|nr:hypothetical protein BT93_F1136 [Corymbia citriodora subsp. variegata]
MADPPPFFTSPAPETLASGPHSCEASFANGFTRRLDGGGGGRRGGWFRCFCSETLECSICEGGELRMSPERIRMAVGGERLDGVMGRERGVGDAGVRRRRVPDRRGRGWPRVGV